MIIPFQVRLTAIPTNSVLDGVKTGLFVGAEWRVGFYEGGEHVSVADLPDGTPIAGGDVYWWGAIQVVATRYPPECWLPACDPAFLCQINLISQGYPPAFGGACVPVAPVRFAPPVWLRSWGISGDGVPSSYLEGFISGRVFVE